MGFTQEFKTFIAKGNVLDLAVGVIIGGAFGKIVTSLVDDIIMPPIGKVLSKVDFKELYINLSGKEYPTLDAAKKAGAATVNYGLFFNNIVSFLIVAFSMFLVVKAANKMRALAEEAPAPPPPPAEPPAQEKLLTEIRDLLKSK